MYNQTILYNQNTVIIFLAPQGQIVSTGSKAPLLAPMFPTHLASLVQQLVLKLLDPQDLLEHLVELVFAQDELGSGAGCHALLRLSWVLVSAVDGVKLSHPGTQHSLLA